MSTLALYNWTNNIFDPDVLLPFPNLKNFTICRSAVRLIDKPFAGMQLLQVGYKTGQAYIHIEVILHSYQSDVDTKNVLKLMMYVLYFSYWHTYLNY